MTAGAPALDFLLVGTPRSGTTLTQRLCTELPGVVMPPETHFLQLLGPQLLTEEQWPLPRTAAARALDHFLRLPTSRGLHLEPARALELAPDPCPSVLHLFAAVARTLAGAGAGHLVGEKTPEHLLWWRLATAAAPTLRVVGVVRDPRAVAVSHRRVPWGIEDAVELAEEWAFDQRRLLHAAGSLGAERCLLLRYEDVTADPAAARARIGRFLRVADPEGVAPQPDGIVHGWEWWKQRATGPVTSPEVDAWRRELPPRDAAAVVAVAGPEMARFGYAGSRRPDRRGGDPVTRARLARRLLRMRDLERRPGAGPVPRRTP